MSAQRPQLSLIVVAALVGCGGEEEPDQACFEHLGNVVVPEESDVPLQGKITLLDRDTRTLGDDGLPQALHQGRIQGAFFDVSTRTATDAAFMALSDECLGRISRGQPATGLVPLALSSLEVRGTARGTVRASEVDSGLYLDAGDPILGAGSLEVVGEGDSFPAFDEMVTAPDPLAISDPPLDGTTLVELGDLNVAWNKGNGDFVVIAIDPDQTMGVESGGDVVCVMPDDGCQTLPASVAVFLLASQADTFTLIVSRHRYRSVTLDDRTFLEIESIAEVRGTLKNGVAE